MEQRRKTHLSKKEQVRVIGTESKHGFSLGEIVECDHCDGPQSSIRFKKIGTKTNEGYYLLKDDWEFLEVNNETL